MGNKFGIVLTTYVGDFFLTKGLLASIKKFMPHVPICIIQDGDFSLDELFGVYNITNVIRKKDVKDEFLRQNCFGSRCTNMIAFWEGPFEKFLYLDSDLVLWGDILQHINLEEADFFHNEPHEEYTPIVYKKQYFDYEKVFNYLEEFNWKACHFFNSGVFIAKRGVIDLEKFKELYWLWKKDKLLIPTAPQGMINYLVFKASEKKELTLCEKHLQTIVPVLTTERLEQMFAFFEGQPVITKPTVIHWAGLKPLNKNKDKVFVSPERYFRLLHLKNVHSVWRFLPDIYFYYEEFVSILKVYHSGSVIKYLLKKIGIDRKK